MRGNWLRRVYFQLGVVQGPGHNMLVKDLLKFVGLQTILVSGAFLKTPVSCRLRRALFVRVLVADFI